MKLIYSFLSNSHLIIGNTIESMQTQTHLRPKSLSTKITAGGGIAADNNDDMMNSQENISLNLHQRRHAINITNNPGYKVKV